MSIGPLVPLPINLKSLLQPAHISKTSTNFGESEFPTDANLISLNSSLGNQSLTSADSSVPESFAPPASFFLPFPLSKYTPDTTSLSVSPTNPPHERDLADEIVIDLKSFIVSCSSARGFVLPDLISIGRNQQLSSNETISSNSSSSYLQYEDFVTLNLVRNESLGLWSSLEYSSTSEISFPKNGITLSGPFPKWIDRGKKRLKWLEQIKRIHLNNNLIVGNLPTFAFCTNLREISLENNALHKSVIGTMGMPISSSITIPPSWPVNLQWLEIIRLRNCGLEGEIPTAFENFKFLKVFDISENRLTGDIPSFCLLNWKHINVFDIHGNSFKGTLPEISHEACEHLFYFDVSNNNLSGTISLTYCNLGRSGNSKLKYFSIENNGFWGPRWSQNSINEKRIYIQQTTEEGFDSCAIYNRSLFVNNVLCILPCHSTLWNSLPFPIQHLYRLESNSIDSSLVTLKIAKAFIPRPSDDIVSMLSIMGFDEETVLLKLAPGCILSDEAIDHFISNI